MIIQSALVFCGSSKGRNPIYEKSAYELGKSLAQRGIRLVYGAGNVGLMGVLADAALEHGGEVTGIIPYFLRDREVCHLGLTELVVVQSMAERKLVMAERADTVITLPGGYGTLDELFEMLTLVQLSQAAHPIGIWNVNGFFDPLIMQLEKMHEEQFLKDIHRKMLLVSSDLDDLFTKIENFEPTMPVGKWQNS
ncbi:MAG: TIGR00730 family Rossman fold protein [Saprospiraceae bacterium]|nr:TIGR00730 family Rossman fold protein [Saprospiraceae bacterium]